MSAQNLILRVIDGPARGVKFSLDPGTVVIGRGGDISVHIEDPTVSRHHAEIAWDGHEGVVRDLRSRAGVLLNGAPVSEAPIRPGDTLQIGQTLLRIETPSVRRRLAPLAEDFPGVEGEPPTGTIVVPVAILEQVEQNEPQGDPGRPEEGSLLAALVGRIAADTDRRLYAIVDGAQAFELAFNARRLGCKVYTLFSGQLSVPLSHVGPCLVVLDQPIAFLHLWVDAIGSHAGVLLLTHEELPAVHAHLRSTFIVTDGTVQEYFFRYYDPRVLRTFLPTCTESELGEFFGPVTAWIYEDEKAEGFVAATVERGALLQAPVAAKKDPATVTIAPSR